MHLDLERLSLGRRITRESLNLFKYCHSQQFTLFALDRSAEALPLSSFSSLGLFFVVKGKHFSLAECDASVGAWRLQTPKCYQRGVQASPRYGWNIFNIIFQLASLADVELSAGESFGYSAELN